MPQGSAQWGPAGFGDFGPAGGGVAPQPISPPTRPPWQPLADAPVVEPVRQQPPEPVARKLDYLVPSEDMDGGGEMVAPSVIGSNERFL